MKKLLIGCLALLAPIFSSCAENKTETDMKNEDNKVLVAYYSATGTTEKIAKEIASATNGRLFEIEPEKEYTSADLNWNDRNSRSSVEMNDLSSRPAIKNGVVNLDSIETVFIGYPIWWDQAPRVVNTFIESNNLIGKKVITFCTSGGSTINGSTRTLRETYPDLDITQGKCLNGTSKSKIETWVKSILRCLD
ncbi:MAG: flavodoxin [Muribaculaceae bacterium]|nr:flavodoxin [Muribaculaceae bacterium]